MPGPRASGAKATNDKVLSTLEFDKVLERLAGLTSFSAGRELALALRPFTDREAVARRQALLAETRHLRRTRPHLGLAGAHDVRQLASKAALSGVLEPHELLDIQSTLTTAQRLRGNLTRLALSYPLLSELAKEIVDQGTLVVEIGRCISAQAEVTDAASPALAAVRRESRVVRDRLQSRVQEILTNAMGRGIAQEALITERDGRYVIPVKADFRGQMRGIVHDVSGSGATLWIEPLAVVDLGNQYRELQLEERRELERVLRQLSDLVGKGASHLIGNVERLAQLDLLQASARLGEELHAEALPLDGQDQPWIVDAPAELRLDRARHPLLAGDVVPTSLAVGGAHHVLLITGPNTGGKTVALKTAGLLTLMALAGLPVPAAEETRVPVYHTVFADIGDEQSIEQSLSTFSSHMRTIIGILGQADSRSLVLLDELGAGTDPEEGAALARAIVQHLLERGCAVVATTHHGELKVFAHETPGVTNAHVEFDTETLSPTYRLTIGLPGRSNAIAIAERLGLPEAVLALARSHVAPELGRVDELLADLQRERRELAATLQQQRDQVAEIEATRQSLAAELNELQSARDDLLIEAREQLEDELAEVRRALREATRTAERAERRELPPAQAAVAAAETVVKQLRRRLPAASTFAPAAIVPEQIRAGDQVSIRGLDRPGEAVAPPDERGEVELQLGALRMRVKLQQIAAITRPAGAAPVPQPTVSMPARAASPGLELDMRGQHVEEALHVLEQYLESAFLAGLPFTRIIHGKGTGTLRRVVREALAASPFVSSIESAEPRSGGDGVTIAKLAL